jgi:hypothetical protein
MGPLPGDAAPGGVGSCPVYNPHYDFNDAALPIGKLRHATGRDKVATTLDYLKTLSTLHKHP